MKETMANEMSLLYLEKLQRKIKEKPDIASVKVLLDEELTKMAHGIQGKECGIKDFLDRFESVRQDEVFAQDDTVILNPLGDEVKTAFLETTFAYSNFKGAYDMDGFSDGLWADHFKPFCYYCSIHDQATGEYLGYCGIKDLRQESWELAIELMPTACGRGYGYQGLGLFLERVRAVTDQRLFTAKVMPDNIPSQKLMEKLGATPKGIDTFLIDDEDILAAIEEKHLDMIDERLVALAARFGVEPRKLLSHALVYQFS